MSDQEDNTDISNEESSATDDKKRRSSGCPFHNNTNETKEASQDPSNDTTAKPRLADRPVNRRSAMRTALTIDGDESVT